MMMRDQIWGFFCAGPVGKRGAPQRSGGRSLGPRAEHAHAPTAACVACTLHARPRLKVHRARVRHEGRRGAPRPRQREKDLATNSPR